MSKSDAADLIYRLSQTRLDKGARVLWLKVDGQWLVFADITKLRHTQLPALLKMIDSALPKRHRAPREDL